MAQQSTPDSIAAPADRDAGGTTRHERPWSPLMRLSPRKLLAALILYICSAPFIEDIPHGHVITSVLMTLVLVTATMAMGSRRWTRIVARYLLIPAMAARWAAHVRPDLIPPEVFSATGMVFVGFVAINIVGFILRAPEVSSDVLCAGICGYLLIGLFWAFAYALVWRLSANAFLFEEKAKASHVMQGFTADYFSYITLCSVGYGDIVPTSPVARMLAMTEAMTGTFYVAIMIARLVALHSTRKGPEDAGASNGP